MKTQLFEKKLISYNTGKTSHIAPGDQAAVFILANRETILAFVRPFVIANGRHKIHLQPATSLLILPFS